MILSFFNFIFASSAAEMKVLRRTLASQNLTIEQKEKFIMSSLGPALDQFRENMKQAKQEESKQMCSLFLRTITDPSAANFRALRRLRERIKEGCPPYCLTAHKPVGTSQNARDQQFFQNTEDLAADSPQSFQQPCAQESVPEAEPPILSQVQQSMIDPNSPSTLEVEPAAAAAAAAPVIGLDQKTSKVDSACCIIA